MSNRGDWNHWKLKRRGQVFRPRKIKKLMRGKKKKQGKIEIPRITGSYDA